jgi:hypothetical protein
MFHQQQHVAHQSVSGIRMIYLSIQVQLQFCVDQYLHGQIYGFIHSWISEAHCKKTNIWWLVYKESVDMFCYLCRKNYTCNLQNKSKVFNMTPSVFYKKSAIFDHADTDQHKTAIELELTILVQE